MWIFFWLIFFICLFSVKHAFKMYGSMDGAHLHYLFYLQLGITEKNLKCYNTILLVTEHGYEFLLSDHYSKGQM